MPLYPLRFAPLFRRYLWGGRRLNSVLHKPIGPEPCAESWEIVDRGADQSLVINGPLAGTSLHELVVGHGPALLGLHHPQPRFPLLFKLIDADQVLSVQVHPDDARAAQMSPPDLGKTEAWVVLAAEPQSAIYAGLKRGFDRAAFAREVHRGTCELCLHRFEPRAGDCIFIPAGTVHALGAGVLIAEIQQASDATLRLFDWNRVGADGRPRALHVAEALEAIDDTAGPIAPLRAAQPRPAGVERLVACDKFILDRQTLKSESLASGSALATPLRPTTLGGDGRCHIIAIVAGQASIEHPELPPVLGPGEVVLLPADSPRLIATTDAAATLLDAYLP
ncbi:MAG TPA: type I phosphomannose isomerase catalytic subunit [Pirellulales bacterium]|jgi:mannose-6-phosphate isomerase|nr:type I phosphomannose isomerase catalytic subunit [Pirellulales bacterium]